MKTNVAEEYRGWDAKYREQSEGAAWSETPQPKVLEFLAKLPPHCQIADLGAGDGRNTAPAVQQGHQIVMLDIAPSAVAQALERFEETKGCKPFGVIGPMEEMPLASNQFDAIMVLDALPQVKNCQRAVHEIHRILKPGGLCLVNVFTINDVAWGEGERVGPRSFSYKNCLFSFFGEEDLPEMCKGLFNIVEVDHLNWVDPPHVPFRPFEHRHDAFFYLIQKP